MGEDLSQMLLRKKSVAFRAVPAMQVDEADQEQECAGLSPMHVNEWTDQAARNQYEIEKIDSFCIDCNGDSDECLEHHMHKAYFIKSIYSTEKEGWQNIVKYTGRWYVVRCVPCLITGRSFFSGEYRKRKFTE